MGLTECHCHHVHELAENIQRLLDFLARRSGQWRALLIEQCGQIEMRELLVPPMDDSRTLLAVLVKQSAHLFSEAYVAETRHIVNNRLEREVLLFSGCGSISKLAERQLHIVHQHNLDDMKECTC